jgi:hypothetical protein
MDMSDNLFFSTNLNYRQEIPKFYKDGFIEGYIKAASDKQLRLIRTHDSTHSGPYEKFTFEGAFGHLKLDYFQKSDVRQKIKMELDRRYKDPLQFQSSFGKAQKSEDYKKGFTRGYITAGPTEELQLLLLEGSAQSFTGGFDSFTFRKAFEHLNLDFFETRDAKEAIKHEIKSREYSVAESVKEKPSFRFGGLPPVGQ